MRTGKQHGAALAVTLIMMVAVLAIGVATSRAAIMAERQARSERDRHVALESAEAALRDAERDIESTVNAARAALFAPGSMAGFVPGCGRTGHVNAGLCLATGPHPAWQAVDLEEEGDQARTVRYGAFTGQSMPTGEGPMPARPPRYIIEAVAIRRAGDDASVPTPNVYRITAIGVGAHESTRVVLQSFYRKVGP